MEYSFLFLNEYVFLNYSFLLDLIIFSILKWQILAEYFNIVNLSLWIFRLLINNKDKIREIKSKIYIRAKSILIYSA